MGKLTGLFEGVTVPQDLRAEFWGRREAGRGWR